VVFRGRPRGDLIIDASYSLIRQVHARVTYVAAPWRFFTGFDWGDETYFLSDRPTSDDRVYYYDKRLTTGVQWPLTQSLKLELSSGYVFERFYYEGGNLLLGSLHEPPRHRRRAVRRAAIADQVLSTLTTSAVIGICLVDALRLDARARTGILPVVRRSGQPGPHFKFNELPCKRCSHFGTKGLKIIEQAFHWLMVAATVGRFQN
jgi:hypothetical protein